MPEFCADTSVLGRVWQVRPDPDTQFPPPVMFEDGSQVATEVVSIAWRRGATDVEAFLDPKMTDSMPDPFVLHGMERAVECFCQAIVERRRIAILGDYDVDGATSTSMLLRYQRMLRLDEGLFHIPQRLSEGYGPNIPAIDKLAAQGTQLLVIADSGTAAVRQIAHARAIGLDVVVLDHHEPNEDGSVPDAILVNPKLAPNDGSMGYLCTAGLVFLFLVACNRHLRKAGHFVRTATPEPRLMGLLGLVALGTVADLVPLRGLNRAYVAMGLEAMDLIPGIRILGDVVNEYRRNEADHANKAHQDVGYTAYSCGFVFGPCINAGGRISDTRQGTWLLSTDDPVRAREIAVELNGLNYQRQQMQKAMVEECFAMVADPGPQDSVLVLYNPDWHPGVVGLGASKVKDRFDRSAVVIGAGGKGSGRSAEGFNIGTAFGRALTDGMLASGGGHAPAGGLTIDPARIDQFREFMQERSRGLVRPATMVDLAVPLGHLDVETVDSFEMLAPFGMGNPKPRIVLTGGVVAWVGVLKGKHVKARLVNDMEEMEAILFNAVDTPLGDAMQASLGHRVDVLGEVGINTFRGANKLQIKPTDIMVGANVAHLEAAEVDEGASDNGGTADRADGAQQALDTLGLLEQA